MTTFSADEIFEMAQQIERNGAAFYRTAAEGSQAGGVKDLLLELAEMEDEHERTFAELRKELAPKGYRASGHSGDDPGLLYLRAMVAGKVFDAGADPAAALTGEEAPESILRTAIGLEKDSIVFYLGMREMVPGGPEKAKIDEIIKQEMDHVGSLSDQLAERACGAGQSP